MHPHCAVETVTIVYQGAHPGTAGNGGVWPDGHRTTAGAGVLHEEFHLRGLNRAACRRWRSSGSSFRRGTSCVRPRIRIASGRAPAVALGNDAGEGRVTAGGTRPGAHPYGVQRMGGEAECRRLAAFAFATAGRAVVRAVCRQRQPHLSDRGSALRPSGHDESARCADRLRRTPVERRATRAADCPPWPLRHEHPASVRGGRG